MEIKTEKKENILIISIIGMLDSSNYQSLDENVQTCIQEGSKNIIFNLENLEYLSSAGIRVFIKTYRTLQGNGGNMVFSCLKPFVLEIFDMAGISNGFMIYPDEETAYQSFTM
jgi:anti-sigma B factor antagonist